MVVTYLRTKFHAPSSSGLLVIATKSKAKYRFHVATIIFRFYRKITLTKVAKFFEDLLQ